MTTDKAVAFVRAWGVVLVSGMGPVPRLTEAIVNAPIRGSWWAHPSHHILAVLQAVTHSDAILVGRLVDGKVTLVHRRLWPALVRVAKRFPANRIRQVQEEHTSAGYHRTREVPFPMWVPAAVKAKAQAMGDEEALTALGPWARMRNQRSKGRRSTRRDL